MPHQLAVLNQEWNPGMQYSEPFILSHICHTCSVGEMRGRGYSGPAGYYRSSKPVMLSIPDRVHLSETTAFEQAAL